MLLNDAFSVLNEQILARRRKGEVSELDAKMVREDENKDLFDIIKEKCSKMAKATKDSLPFSRVVEGQKAHKYTTMCSDDIEQDVLLIDNPEEDIENNQAEDQEAQTTSNRNHLPESADLEDEDLKATVVTGEAHESPSGNY